MLCDDVIADRCSGYDGMYMGRFLPRIRGAQRFTLGPDFAAVADALSSDYTGLVRAFPFCRLPYKTMWVEFAQMDRPNFAAAGIQIPAFQVRPKRIGCLLEATRDDLSAWKAHLFWSLANDTTCCPAMAMKFDMSLEISHGRLPTREEIENDYRNSILLRDHVYNSHPGWEDAADSVKITMMNHTVPIAPDYGLPRSLGMIEIPPDRFHDVCQGINDLARSDWAGEPAFILAVIGLMNARNAVETVSVDHTKLNRARIKRGKLPFLEYKTLKIAQRRINRIYPDGQHRANYAPMRGHFVKGHWKVRKTGIYFWHPHARGSFGRGLIEKEYQL
jgi:hypothetical protein